MRRQQEREGEEDENSQEAVGECLQKIKMNEF